MTDSGLVLQDAHSTNTRCVGTSGDWCHSYHLQPTDPPLVTLAVLLDVSAASQSDLTQQSSGLMAPADPLSCQCRCLATIPTKSVLWAATEWASATYIWGCVTALQVSCSKHNTIMLRLYDGCVMLYAVWASLAFDCILLECGYLARHMPSPTVCHSMASCCCAWQGGQGLHASRSRSGTVWPASTWRGSRLLGPPSPSAPLAGLRLAVEV